MSDETQAADLTTNIVESTEVKEYTSFEDMKLSENLLRGIFAHGFEKPSKIQQKTVERIEILCVDEFNLILNNHRLKGEFLGQRSVNVTGDIRIIYRKEGSTIILLLQIGSHSQLY